MTIDLAQFTPALTALAVVLGITWSVYRFGKNLMARDFVTRAEFDKFVTEQKAHDRSQSAAAGETSKNLNSLADELHQMAVDVRWITESLKRQERLLTGEHRRPDIIGGIDGKG